MMLNNRTRTKLKLNDAIRHAQPLVVTYAHRNFRAANVDLHYMSYFHRSSSVNDDLINNLKQVRTRAIINQELKLGTIIQCRLAL